MVTKPAYFNMSNLSPYETNLKGEGTARNQRFSQALNPSTVAIDDRKMENFLAYVQHYNSKVVFVDSEEPFDPDDTWDNFFRNEPAFLMARIATKDPLEITTAFERLMKQFEKSISNESLRQLAEFTFSRFEKIDRWYASISNHPFEDELALNIRSYLAIELHKLVDILRYLSTGKKGDPSPGQTYKLQNKNNIWDSSQPLAVTADTAFAGKNQEEKLRSASFVINGIFNTVYYSTRSINGYCQNYFTGAIFDRQDEEPHVALFIAFIKLLGYAQEQLNKLPKKLLDYYYREFLKIKPRGPVPDQSFVIPELVKGFEEFRIPKGSVLTAGKDHTNKELFYTTDKDVVINKSEVKSLVTLTIQKKDDNISRFYANILKRNGVSPVNAKGELVLYKPFGGKERTVTIGFAIASTQFYLAKSHRNITVQFTVEEKIIHESFEDSLFALRFTSEKGWIDSRNQNDLITITSFKKTGDNTLELNFIIPIAQASGITAYSTEIHSGNYATKLPMMQFLVSFPTTSSAAKATADYESKIAKLNELLSLRIQNAMIKVEVGTVVSRLSFNGVRDLDIENHDSEMDPSKPFYPFTTMPKVGSSFYIGCPDLYYKNIERLSLNIEWMLPDNFETYYEKYFPPYDSNRYRATLSKLENKKWLKVSEVSLIDTTDNGGKFRSLRIERSKIKIEDEKSEGEKDVSKFDTSKKDGTLRLKLLYPDFGHSIYPQLITSSVLEKSTSKSATIDYYKIVKKQLYDSVISIKLPDDISNKEGSLRVVTYDILEKVADDNRARGMMINGLAEKLKEFNGSDVVFKQVREAVAEEMAIEAQSKVVVNDDRFISRILSFLKNIRIIEKNIHFDQDKQDVDDVAIKLRGKMNTKASMMLPAEWELASLIITEINSAINQIVIRIVDEILMRRKQAMPDGETVNLIFKKHVDAANEVINDMIARKIAILLSAFDIPPKPYTPQINTISLNYVSTKTLEAGSDQFFHITPFGVAEIHPFLPVPKSKTSRPKLLLTNRLFPLNDNNETLTIKEEGHLYIGLQGIRPSQTVTLFFQLEESEKKTDVKPPPLNWWYLQYNQWYAMEEDRIISDTTFGLQTTGIVEIDLPAGINKGNTFFDDEELSWLCVSVGKVNDAFPYLVDVKAQAVPITFQNNENDPAHFALPIPPSSIKAFVDPMPGIKTVRQPVASSHGKMEENEEEYYSRVSERLRHKQRAITAWDYEHLLLEEFPFIYKVNCINNYFKNQVVPGHVTLVPIVNLKNKGVAATGLAEPRVNYWDLRRMEAFIQDKTSPFVRVHAINPEVHYVHVRCRIKLKQGKDKGYFLKVLNDELRGFLTPWASNNEETISYSAKLYLSSVISFIEAREYVAYVTDIEMNQYTEDGSGERVYSKAPNGTLSLFETISMAPHAILTSSSEHEIELI